MRTFQIILADDEQQILHGMERGIDWEELGFSVAGTAQNGKEALELMEEYHPDLVISDIKMPFMDGLELAKNIHENKPRPAGTCLCREPPTCKAAVFHPSCYRANGCRRAGTTDQKLKA